MNVRTASRGLWTLGMFCLLFLSPSLIPTSWGQKSKSPKNQPTTMDSVSYALGVLFANNLSDQGFNSLDGASLREGFEHALAGTSNLTPEQADGLVRRHLTALKEEEGQKTLAEGENFLKSNGLVEGVVTTSTGLQYRHEVIGEGASPDANDEVTVHYRGTLINGEEFDSSYRRGEPTSFPLNGVIRGWTEGLQTMNVGGKTTFFIPQDLAYGARPAPGGKIPPYAALIFEVELLEVRPVD